MFEAKDKIIITDPCYGMNSKHQFIVGAKKGYWVAAVDTEVEIIKDYDDFEYIRVNKLWAGYIDCGANGNCSELLGYCGVDSGMLGVFPTEGYLFDKKKCDESFCPFYEECCNITSEYSNKIDDYLRDLKLIECMKEMDLLTGKIDNGGVQKFYPNGVSYPENIKYPDSSGYVEKHGSGFVSLTNYGDGSYPVYVRRNNKDEIIGIEVYFK